MSQILQDLFAGPISQGTIVNYSKSLAEAVSPVTKQISSLVKKAAVKDID